MTPLHCYRWPLVLILLTGVAAPGCASKLTYPGHGTWSKDVTSLGPVVVSHGGWWRDTDEEGASSSLSLNTPPEAYTYHAALLKKASREYAVPREELVLGDVEVQILAELSGTIRAWKAEALAGRMPAP